MRLKEGDCLSAPLIRRNSEIIEVLTAPDPASENFLGVMQVKPIYPYPELRLRLLASSKEGTSQTNLMMAALSHRFSPEVL